MIAESWKDLVTRHFYGIKMRPVSAFDPSGFVIIVSATLLVVGIIIVGIRALLNKHSVGIERQLQNMSDRVEQGKTRVKENLEYVKDQAIVRTQREGYTIEMLSFAYLSRLGFSLIVFAIASYLNALAAVIAGWRTPEVVILTLNREHSGLKTLPDLGHDLFKHVMTKIYGPTAQIEWYDLPDEFIAAVGTTLGVLLLLHPRRLLILRRFCAIFAMINLMRAFCVAVTSLPDASPMCISQFGTPKGDYKSTPIFPRAFIRAWKVLTRPSQHITCGDMVFSGHAVFLMLCAMIVRTYCIKAELNTPFTRKFPFVLWLVRYFVYIGTAGGLFAIVGTRLHYTLDVLIAIYVTTQVWSSYHWLSTHPDCDFRILNWLEHKDVHYIDLDAYRRAKRTSSVGGSVIEETFAEHYTAKVEKAD